MSKYVKQLVTRDIQRQLDGVEDAVLVSYVGMDANTTNELRGELDAKDIRMMVVKNSLARSRYRKGQPRWSQRLKVPSGQVAVCFGGEADFITLVKELVRLDKDDETSTTISAATCGVMDGEKP